MMLEVKEFEYDKEYGYYYIPFMKMYKELVNADLDYHQVHIEEYLYREKKLQRKR